MYHYSQVVCQLAIFYPKYETNPINIVGQVSPLATTGGLPPGWTYTTAEKIVMSVLPQNGGVPQGYSWQLNGDLDMHLQEWSIS